MKISILNFNEILRRKDLVRPTWFAIDVDLFTHQDFYRLTAEELRAWLWILTISVCAKSEHMCVDFDHFEFQTRSSKNVLLATIEKLEGKRLRVREPFVERTDHVQHRQTDRQTENTNKQEEEEGAAELPAEYQDHGIDEDQLEMLPTVPNGTLVPAPPSPQSLISQIPAKTLARWAALYPEDFLRRELLKALNYYESNPRKLPKTVGGWSRTLAAWFERGWEWSAKKYPGQAPAGKVDISEILKERADAAR